LRTSGHYFELTPNGQPHVLFEYIYRMRSVLLKLGFSEIVLPTIVNEKDVLLQYGPEGYIILDRVYYLAGLARPDIGISKRVRQKLQQCAPGIEIATLQTIFRDYKRGTIEADDLLETMVTRLQIREDVAARILTFFPAFRRMKPVPSPLTLRSHTTASWFTALHHLQRHQPLPLQLFSIGKKYRREQKVDASHLLESWTASLVLMHETMSLEDGQQIVAHLFQDLGYVDVKTVIKKATSKYYAPQTEFEVFIKHPTTQEYLEVGDGGFYSPVSLAQYDIPYPVFNFGMGIERLIMIEHNFTDIRNIVYPYLYTEHTFTDRQIAQDIAVGNRSQYGEALVKSIVQKAAEHANAPSPCQVELFAGPYLQKHVTIRMIEQEPNKRLLGPAAFNLLTVQKGNIIGSPLHQIPPDATRTPWTYMDGIAHLVVHAIEEAIGQGEEEARIRVGLVKRLSEINFTTSERVRRYIESKHGRIDVRGPVFADIRVEVSEQ
jgi:O-phosphoseryl-tRNA synthetase